MGSHSIKKGRLASIYLTGTSPPTGFWMSRGEVGSVVRNRRWEWNNSKITWTPEAPADGLLRKDSIRLFVESIQQIKEKGLSGFLKLSGTSKTGITWSLPAIASCPLIDETCSTCYALDGWYRTNRKAQVGRVLRLEYLQRLIRKGQLDSWTNWISSVINNLKPVEHVPVQVPTYPQKESRYKYQYKNKVPYFRWHDSGDLFHADYARAIFEVCRQTPDVLHWLPTRMGLMLANLVSQGLLLPENIAIQISAHQGGVNESYQKQAVERIRDAQPSALVGITYTYKGQKSRVVDEQRFRKEFGMQAFLCPATVAKTKEERTCMGCRKCWVHASTKAPIIYATHLAN